MEALLSILSGSATGALLVYFLRGWISERLQQSIRHEYSQKLATHKTELKPQIQAIRHENELRQLRTSLFFDHQRNAFAGLLAKIAAVNQMWIDKEFVRDEGLSGPVPDDAYKELQAAYYEHQLFLDSPCLAAMELVFECYRGSFPCDDGSGAPPQSRDNWAAYEAVQYLQHRLAELFQSRIGVTTRHRAKKEIALLAAIRLLNTYHFTELEIPPQGTLALGYRDQPPDAVRRAEDNLDDLLGRLECFRDDLRREGGGWPEASLKATRYLEMLERDENQVNRADATHF